MSRYKKFSAWLKNQQGVEFRQFFAIRAVLSQPVCYTGVGPSEGPAMINRHSRLTVA